MNADVQFAMELADLAGSMAMERFGARDLAVQSKLDGSPVTEADRAIEVALRERISRDRPEHAITGEELGESGASEWRWYLDPIDGTTSYIAGRDSWKVLIALVRAGEPMLAVVDAPAQGSRWWAVRGDGAFRDRRRLRVSSTASLEDAKVSDDWRGTLAGGVGDGGRGTLAGGVGDHPLARVAARCGEVRPHRGHSFLAVAAGETDVAVGVGGFAWDYAPMMLIVQEAGGTFTDFRGDVAFDRGEALVSNGLVHEQARRAIWTPDWTKSVDA